MAVSDEQVLESLLQAKKNGASRHFINKKVGLGTLKVRSRSPGDQSVPFQMCC